MGYRYAVLVVEDDLSWQINYQEILEEAGYLVELATGKEAAACQLQEHIFDVAIVDLRLADNDPKNTDGIEVIKLMRDLGMSTRVIVKSGYLTEEIQKRLNELQVYEVLNKEGSARLLTDSVARAVLEKPDQPAAI
jgi:DNA-binding NtrC family response regulator